jgi:AraC-like DNA-binding protein
MRNVVNHNQHAGIAVSDYREFLPPPALAEYLVCLWTQTVPSPVEFAQRVVPDGCVDILLMNEVPMVVGPWIEPFVASLAPGTKILGARCHPGVAPSLLGIPASELLNRFVPLSEVWSSAETARFSRIAYEPNLSVRMRAMEAALLGRVVKASPADKATRAAIQWMARHARERVEQLSHRLGLSSRQIQRRFTAAVGYGPKLFQSVLRFQRLLNLAAKTSVRGSLAQIAVDAEYADQAHMTREVRRFSGDLPGTLLQSPRCALRLSGLIQTTDGLDP